MALQGSLSDFGIAEILQLIGSQAKTGVLHVVGGPDSDDVQVWFSNGRIIGSEVASRDQQDALGQMLLAAEAVTRAQISAAQKQSAKTLERVADVLVGQGVIDDDTRTEFVELQLRETLYRMFEWKAGQYRFEGKPPNFTRPVCKPMSAEHVLMEGFRLQDEWPLVRTKVNNYAVIYRRAKEVEDLETEADALERILDDAFSEFVDEAVEGGRGKKATGAASNLGRGERRVLSLIDGKRSVHTLIDLSRLGEFETCKALVGLLNEGYVVSVRQKRALEAPTRKRGGRWTRVLGKGVLNVLALGAVGGGLFFMPRSRIELQENSVLVVTEAHARLRANRIAVIDVALDVYRLEHGQYPDQLDDLLEQKLVTAVVLTPPGDTPLRYLSIRDDYDLR